MIDNQSSDKGCGSVVSFCSDIGRLSGADKDSFLSVIGRGGMI